MNTSRIIGILMGISARSIQVVLAVIIAGLPAAALADDYSWNNPAGGLADDPANWDISSPSASNHLQFELGNQSYSIDMLLPFTPDSARIGNDDVTWNFYGDTLQFNSGGALTVAPQYEEQGSLTIHNGQVIVDEVVLGEWESSQSSLSLREGSYLVADTIKLGGDESSYAYLSDATLKIGDSSDTEYSQVDSRNAYLGTVWGTTATVNIDYGSWTTDNLHVGLDGTGTINVNNGGLVVNNQLYVGASPYDLGSGAHGQGSLIVDGLSSLDSQADTYVGWSGNGNLTIRNGATAMMHSVFIGGLAPEGETVDESDQTVATVLVDSGAYYEAAETVIAGGGPSSLTINGESEAHLGTWTMVDGYSSQLVVSGSSFAETGQLFIAESAQGNVVISDGAELTTDEVRLAHEGTGSISVDGTDTQLKTARVYVGQSTGSGAISVTGGATFYSSEVNLGANSGTASLSASGAGTEVVSGTFNLGGDGGTAAITASDGAQIHALESIYVATVGDSATVTIESGATVSASSQIEVAQNGRIDISNGRIVAQNSGYTVSGPGLDVHSGGVVTLDDAEVFANGVRIGNNGRLEVTGGGLSTIYNPLEVAAGGILSVDGSLVLDTGDPTEGLSLYGHLEGSGWIGTSVFNSGVVTVGESIGSLTMDNYSESELSQMVMEIAGYGGGVDFDQVFVLGDTELAGTLIVELLDTFIPEIGDSFDLLTSYNLINGEFRNLVLPDLATGLEWLIDYNDGSYRPDGGNVTLSVQAASVVPIPAAVWLLGSALAGLGWFGRQRRK